MGSDRKIAEASVNESNGQSDKRKDANKVFATAGLYAVSCQIDRS